METGPLGVNGLTAVLLVEEEPDRAAELALPLNLNMMERIAPVGLL